MDFEIIMDKVSEVPSNLLQACRACMGRNNVLKPLFLDEKVSQPSLTELIFFVTGLKVDENDGLPNHVCVPCIAMAKNALQFKEMCHQSDMNFRKHLSAGNNVMNCVIKKESEYFLNDEINSLCYAVNNKENVQQDINPLTLHGLYQCALCSSSRSPSAVCLGGLMIIHKVLSQGMTSSEEGLVKRMKNHSWLVAPQLCNKLKEHVKISHMEHLNMTKTDKSKYSCSKCLKSFRSKKGQVSHSKRCQKKEDKKANVKMEIISDSDSDTPLAEKFDTHHTPSSPFIDKSDDVLNTPIAEKIENEDFKNISQFKNFEFNHSKDDGNYFAMQATSDEDFIKVEINSVNHRPKSRKRKLEKHSCNVCNLTLTKALYDAHMNTVHPDENKNDKKHGRKKKIDGVIIGSDTNGDNGGDLIVPLPSFKCTHCERKFSKESSLTAHLKKHESQLNEVHKCDTCKREFKRRAHLENHMLTHFVNKGFKCNLCPKAFTRQDSLTIHLANHRGVKKHQCNFCEKGFNMLSTLKDHIRTHTGEKPFLCSICGRGFSQSTNLKEHVRRHQGYKPFKCEFCSQTFVSKGELEAHTRKHSGAHPFVCDVCGGGFTTSSSLVKHKRIHSGERPYQCDFCPLRFTALGTLKNHRRTHTGEKPYKCQYCDKGFAQKNDLVSHTRTHTGERPYVCSVCGHAFRQSSALKTHFKIHSGQGENMVGIKLGVEIGSEPMKLIDNMDIRINSQMDDSSSSMTLITPKSENGHQ